eukprot:scaffold356263_cov23-Prasinocladus_malaysianus.AAC.1
MACKKSIANHKCALTLPSSIVHDCFWVCFDVFNVDHMQCSHFVALIGRKAKHFGLLIGVDVL